MIHEGIIRAVVLVAAIVFTVPVPGLACDCMLTAADERAIKNVQASWPAEYASVRAGAYAKALRELRSSAALISSIHDGKARACVAAGAQNLIASADAGQTYLAHHPGAFAAADVAAQQAWRTFLNCP